jgi:hypothetical protein
MEIYCTQLGMLITFDYCSSMNDGLPCRRIIDCWKERTDVTTFLRKNYSVEDLKKAFSGLPKTRIQSILDFLGIE